MTDTLEKLHVSEISLATASDTLLAPYGLELGALEPVFGQIMSHHADYADLYFQYTRSEGWSLEEGQVKSGSFSIDQGVGVRVVAGEKTAFAYSDDISLPALESAARATRAIARQGAEHRTAVARRGVAGRCTRQTIHWRACPIRRRSRCWSGSKALRGRSIRA